MKKDESMEVLDLVMKDDGAGFGDQVACCPKCEKPFIIPFEIAFSKKIKTIDSYPCKYCGQMCKIS